MRIPCCDDDRRTATQNGGGLYQSSMQFLFTELHSQYQKSCRAVARVDTGLSKILIWGAHVVMSKEFRNQEAPLYS